MPETRKTSRSTSCPPPSVLGAFATCARPPPPKKARRASGRGDGCLNVVRPLVTCFRAAMLRRARWTTSVDAGFHVSTPSLRKRTRASGWRFASATRYSSFARSTFCSPPSPASSISASMNTDTCWSFSAARSRTLRAATKSFCSPSPDRQRARRRRTRASGVFRGSPRLFRTSGIALVSVRGYSFSRSVALREVGHREAVARCSGARVPLRSDDGVFANALSPGSRRLGARSCAVCVTGRRSTHPDADPLLIHQVVS